MEYMVRTFSGLHMHKKGEHMTFDNMQTNLPKISYGLIFQ